MPTGGNLHQRSTQFAHHEPGHRTRPSLGSEIVRHGLNALAYVLVVAMTLGILGGCGFATYALFADPANRFVRDLFLMSLGAAGVCFSMIWAVCRLEKQWRNS